MITQRFDDPDSLVDGQLVKRPERQCIRHSCKQRMKPLNTAHLAHWWWIGLSSVLRPRQHSIGYMGDGFYRSKDPTNSIKVLKENLQRKTTQRTKKTQNTPMHTHTK